MSGHLMSRCRKKDPLVRMFLHGCCYGVLKRCRARAHAVDARARSSLEWRLILHWLAASIPASKGSGTF